MSDRIEMIGQRFGRLTVNRLGSLSISAKGRKRRLWVCQCDCGKESFVDRQSLLSNNTTSCGCYRSENISKIKTTHGLTKTRTYRCWAAMLTRCTNERSSHFHLYGGAGISVCPQWRDFEVFIADMGQCPSPKHVLDRFPNKTGNYEPNNVRWATQRENCRNKVNNHIISFDGKELTVEEWAEIIGMNPRTLRSRLRLGWSDHEALAIPAKEKVPKGQTSYTAPKRKHISTTVKLAATLLQLGHIPYEESKSLSADEVVSRFDFDHWPIRVIDGGPNEAWNIQPRLRAAHREKTAKIDVPQIAKQKRIRRATAEAQRRLLAKAAGEPKQPSRWPRRPLKSRNTFRSK